MLQSDSLSRFFAEGSSKDRAIELFDLSLSLSSSVSLTFDDEDKDKDKLNNSIARSFDEPSAKNLES